MNSAAISMKLGLETSQMQVGLNQAQQAVNGFEKKVSQAGGKGITLAGTGRVKHQVADLAGTILSGGSAVDILSQGILRLGNSFKLGLGAAIGGVVVALGISKISEAWTAARDLNKEIEGAFHPVNPDFSGVDQMKSHVEELTKATEKAKDGLQHVSQGALAGAGDSLMNFGKWLISPVVKTKKTDTQGKLLSDDTMARNELQKSQTDFAARQEVELSNKRLALIDEGAAKTDAVEQKKREGMMAAFQLEHGARAAAIQLVQDQYDLEIELIKRNHDAKTRALDAERDSSASGLFGLGSSDDEAREQIANRRKAKREQIEHDPSLDIGQKFEAQGVADNQQKEESAKLEKSILQRKMDAVFRKKGDKVTSSGNQGALQKASNDLDALTAKGSATGDAKLTDEQAVVNSGDIEAKKREITLIRQKIALEKEDRKLQTALAEISDTGTSGAIEKANAEIASLQRKQAIAKKAGDADMSTSAGQSLGIKRQELSLLKEKYAIEQLSLDAQYAEIGLTGSAGQKRLASLDIEIAKLNAIIATTHDAKEAEEARLNRAKAKEDYLDTEADRVNMTPKEISDERAKTREKERNKRVVDSRHASAALNESKNGLHGVGRSFDVPRLPGKPPESKAPAADKFETVVRKFDTTVDKLGTILSKPDAALP